MLRHLGREGIAAMVSEHCRLARRMAERLTIEPGIKVLNEVALNQVIVRFGVSDDLDEGNRLTAQVAKRRFRLTGRSSSAAPSGTANGSCGFR